jgi:O-antigen/teichoic acid export membrane protein
MNASDRFFIAKYTGITTVGIYSIAFKYASILTIFNGIFILAWQSFAIKNYNSSAKDVFFSKIFSVYVFLFSLIYLVLVIISKPFLKIVVAPTYYNAWQYIPFLIGSAFFIGISSFFAVSYIISKKTRELFYTSIVFGVINVILNALFVPKYGALSSAFSTLICAVGLLVVRIINTKKHLYIKISHKMFTVYILIIISSCWVQYQDLNNFFVWFLNSLLLSVFLFINKPLLFESIKLIKKIILKRINIKRVA